MSTESLTRQRLWVSTPVFFEYKSTSSETLRQDPSVINENVILKQYEGEIRYYFTT